MITNKLIRIFLGAIATFFFGTTIGFRSQLNKLKDENEVLEAKIDQAEIKAKYIATDVLILQERREILDSLHQTNKQRRNDEKIQLIENACDSTIKRIVLDHIRPE
jgi:hypothetical protein